MTKIRRNPDPPRSLALATVAFLAVAVASAAADELPKPDGATILVPHCKLDYARKSSVGANEPGVLRRVLVRRGDRVEEGQVLASLEDGEHRAELALRAAEARVDVEVRLKAAEQRRANAKFRSSTQLHRRNALNAEQLEIERTEADVAGLAVEQAESRREVARLQQAKAEEAVRSRQVVSPHAGVVTDVVRRPGESLLHGDCVLRVVDVDHIEVSGRVDVGECWGISAGRRVRVWVVVPGADLPVEREAFAGLITFVAPEIDPATQTCAVVAEVSGAARQLRAGLDATMEILPASEDPAPKVGVASRAPR